MAPDAPPPFIGAMGLGGTITDFLCPFRPIPAPG